MTPAPTKPGIQFAGNAAWGAYSQSEMLVWARWNQDLGLPVRVLFAALGRHDRVGHARFAPGELAEVLGIVDLTTGERRKASPSSVSRSIRKAKSIGLIAEPSNAKCLVLGQHTFQKARGSLIECRYH